MKQRKVLLLSLVLMSLVFSGCAGLKTREDLKGSPPGDKSKLQESSVVSSEEVAENKTPPPAEPTPVAAQLPKVAVVLGPGGVKAFAHAGVLKELEKARIPIDAIVGLEWGAMVGALFAQNGKIHEVEWKLYKLQKADLPGKGLFSTRFKAEPIKVLDEYFQKNIGGASVDNAKLEFACPSLSLWSGTLVWQTRGSLKGVLSKCMPYPPLFRPSSPWMAASFALADSVRYLKKKGYKVVIYVNVLGSGELLQQEELLEEYQSALLWQEIRRTQKAMQSMATDVIEVDTKQYKMFDFDNRTGLVGLGELAGSRHARKIAEKYGF